MIGVSAILVTTACTQSPEGSVEELIKTRTPTFSGSTSQLFTTPIAAFTLNGECDPISYGLEYRQNNAVTWTDIPAGCPSGTFSINLIVNGQLRVYVRARTKTGYTPAALATIRLLLPPTTPFIRLVESSTTKNEGEVGTTNEMSFMSTGTMTNGDKLKTSLIDIIYDL